MSIELTIEERFNIVLKDYETAFQYVIESELEKYISKGISKRDAEILVGKKAESWLHSVGML